MIIADIPDSYLPFDQRLAKEKRISKWLESDENDQNTDGFNTFGNVNWMFSEADDNDDGFGDDDFDDGDIERDMERMDRRMKQYVDHFPKGERSG